MLSIYDFGSVRVEDMGSIVAVIADAMADPRDIERAEAVIRRRVPTWTFPTRAQRPRLDSMLVLVATNA